ncbi:MAG: hypothetical protein L0H36_02025 [bacterium]|nr:hypothetical protein [bacterium]MDN5835392.1 hypothetical protein [bacterium]
MENMPNNHQSLEELPDDKEINSNSEYGEQFLNMTEAEARAVAAADNRPVRVVRRDGSSMIVTMDLIPGRLNLSIEDGIVTGVKEESPVTS